MWTLVCVGIFSCSSIGAVFGADLEDIKKAGVIRHLGVPYANFITGSGDGLDVELIKLFARRLDVEYRYVEASWGSVIGDLTGKQVQSQGDDIQIIGKVPIRGDIIANGFTMLEWRKKIVDYSIPTFPTQVWIMARANSSVSPINPAGDIEQDILMVKDRLKGLAVLGKENTCLDPKLYAIKQTGAEVLLFSQNLNELAPAVIKGEADTTLLDVPDALIALEKWPGKIKVIGPVSAPQEMGVAFAKHSHLLKEAFNRFLAEIKADGTYRGLVQKYYPAVFDYYPEFFK
jgi:ABC-type amino acid transport substrate-binding protein